MVDLELSLYQYDTKNNKCSVSRMLYFSPYWLFVEKNEHTYYRITVITSKRIY